MKKYILFTAIASVLSINAYAVSATVTSKDYVDTTRQATIPASGTNSATPGDTVVTYTSTAGTIGERGICDADAYDDGDCSDTNLVTTDVIGSVIDYVDEAMNLPTITTTNRTCAGWIENASHTNENCILWQLVDQTVYTCLQRGAQCTSSSQCCSGSSHPGEMAGDLFCD